MRCYQHTQPQDTNKMWYVSYSSVCSSHITGWYFLLLLPLTVPQYNLIDVELVPSLANMTEYITYQL